MELQFSGAALPSQRQTAPSVCLRFACLVRNGRWSSLHVQRRQTRVVIFALRAKPQSLALALAEPRLGCRQPRHGLAAGDLPCAPGASREESEPLRYMSQCSDLRLRLVDSWASFTCRSSVSGPGHPTLLQFRSWPMLSEHQSKLSCKKST